MPNAAADLVSRPSIPGLRREAPGRREYHRGRVPQLSSPASQSNALMDYDKDVFAATSRESEASKRRTLDLLMEAWQRPLLPLSSEKIRLLGASLKAGRYRSAAQYLSTAKRLHEMADGEVTPALRLALRDARRSCERGLGPARRAEGIPLEALAALPEDWFAPVEGGPVSARAALIAGTWWLTREIELSNAPAAMVSFREDQNGRLAATWHLPASKTDPMALGLERTHGCCCDGGKFQRACPAHTLWHQRAWLRARFPGLHDANGHPSLELPLFPDKHGRPCAKDKVVEVIRAAAATLGFPEVAPDGLQLWGGAMRCASAARRA